MVVSVVSKQITWADSTSDYQHSYDSLHCLWQSDARLISDVDWKATASVGTGRLGCNVLTGSIVQWRPFKKSGKNIDVDASRQSQQLLNHFGNSPGSGGDAIDVPQSPERPSWMIEDDDVVPTHPPPPPPHSSPPPPLPAHSDAYHGKRQSADSSEYYYLVHRDRYPA